jgi:lipopolysaccharide transport system permease protein
MLNLLFQLVLKDMKTRYAHLALGFVWAFLSPLMMTIILYLVFSLFFKMKVEGTPFFLYLASATFGWRFFQDSVMSSSSSLMDSKHLIRESRFPHYLIPLSIVFSNALLFLPSLAILMVVSCLMLGGLPLSVVFLPAVLVLHFVITAGISVVCSVVYVRFRDLKHILETLLLFLFYLTPAFYSLDMVKASVSPLLFKTYMFNPFVGMLNLYRTVLLKGFNMFLPEGGWLYLVGVPVLFGAAILLTAWFVYERKKNSINDYLAY